MTGAEHPSTCTARTVHRLLHGVLYLAFSLKAELRQKLIDSGWRDDLKQFTMGATLCCIPCGHFLSARCSGCLQISFGEKEAQR